MVYRYCGEADILTVFLARAVPGLIAETVSCDVPDWEVFFDIDADGGKATMEIMGASSIVAAHFLDTAMEVEHKRYVIRFFPLHLLKGTNIPKRPFCPRALYDGNKDELCIDLVADASFDTTSRRIYDDVLALVNNANQIVKVVFEKASKQITKK